MENYKNSKTFYMVYAEGKNAPKYRHLTFESAKKEAERLSKELGVRCYVLASQGWTEAVTIKETPPSKVYWFKWISEEQSQPLLDFLYKITNTDLSIGDVAEGDIVFNIGSRILVKKDNDISVSIVAKMVGYEIEIDNLPF